jgi:hypothetical protein
VSPEQRRIIEQRIKRIEVEERQHRAAMAELERVKRWLEARLERSAR